MTIPERHDRRERRKRRGGRPPAFDVEAYRGRDAVERGSNRPKRWRGVATRYEKRATIIAPPMIRLTS